MANAKTGAIQKRANPYSVIENAVKDFGELMPKNVDPERFVRSAVMTIKDNQKLRECMTTKEGQKSIMISLAESARLGMEVGPLLGQAWLIPYGGRCNFQLGYKGMIELARRSNKVKSVSAEVIYENDDYDVQLGTDRKIYHKPDFSSDGRGEPILYYAVIELSEGYKEFAVMSKKEIEIHRDKFSKSKNNGPWVSDFEAMAKKTVVIQALKYCPLSAEVVENTISEEKRMKNVSPEISREAQEFADRNTVDAKYDKPVSEERRDSPKKNNDAEPVLF